MRRPWAKWGMKLGEAASPFANSLEKDAHFPPVINALPHRRKIGGLLAGRARYVHIGEFDRRAAHRSQPH